MRKIGKSANTQLREYQLKLLSTLFESAGNKESILALIDTLFTLSEKQAIAQRAAILFRLRKGDKYFELESSFGVAPATISKAVDLYYKNGDKNRLFNQTLEKCKVPELVYKFLETNKGPRMSSVVSPLNQHYPQLRALRHKK
jgi:uncharacterized protein YerC